MISKSLQMKKGYNEHLSNAQTADFTTDRKRRAINLKLCMRLTSNSDESWGSGHNLNDNLTSEGGDDNDDNDTFCASCGCADEEAGGDATGDWWPNAILTLPPNLGDKSCFGRASNVFAVVTVFFFRFLLFPLSRSLDFLSSWSGMAFSFLLSLDFFVRLDLRSSFCQGKSVTQNDFKSWGGVMEQANSSTLGLMLITHQLTGA